MKYIPLKECSKEPLKEWLEQAKVILAELNDEPDAKKRKAIIYRYRSHWRNTGLLDLLKKLSDNKCWYTEAEFTAEYPHLEHFRPKSYARKECGEICHQGYWWLAFDIDNYRLSKPMPNTCKGTYFPLRERGQAVCVPGVAVTRESPMFLDPANEGDAELISFNALGQPEPCPEPPVELDDWDIQRIEFSIKRYGLDDDDLCNRRKALWIAISNLLGEYASFGLKVKRERCIESAGRAKQIRVELRKYLSAEHEFTSLIRACFLNHDVGRALYPNLLTMPMAA